MSGTIYEGFEAPAGFGTVPLSLLAELGGLAVLRSMVAGALPAPPISAIMAFGLFEVEMGRVVFKGRPDERHLNPLGGIHGGWAAAIMDSALAFAVMTTLKPGEGYTTAEFKLNLVRPISPETGEVFCEGRLVHRGRTLATSEAYLRDGAGRLLAHGTETCAIFPIEAMMRGGKARGE